MNWFFFKDFLPWEIAAVIISGLFIGIAKTGLNGITAVMIPILAIIFGPKESTGILLPMLCFADILAVIWYRRSAEWKHVFRPMPWAVAGVFIALFVEQFIPARSFRFLIGFCIFVGLGIMFYNDTKKEAKIPTAWWFSAIFGLMGGFSTMIGNAAAPIMAVFLLSMRLPKESFVGTTAWFFLIINLIKMPLQIFIWDNISLKSIHFNISMIPVIIIGAFIGIIIVKKVSGKVYRILIYIVTIISTSLLFINFS